MYEKLPLKTHGDRFNNQYELLEVHEAGFYK